ncbi:MAG: 3'-5' exonuclease, partial [candidate division NC10 bacterium]
MRAETGRSLRATTFAFLDTETTGLAPGRGARVCEIAILAVCNGKVKESFASLVNPGCPIDPGAQRIHGITDAMVADSPCFADLAAAVERMLSGTVVV